MSMIAAQADGGKTGTKKKTKTSVEYNSPFFLRTFVFVFEFEKIPDLFPILLISVNYSYLSYIFSLSF